MHGMFVAVAYPGGGGGGGGVLRVLEHPPSPTEEYSK